ncbi:hypothetical protein GCM10027298_35510 [Epidermidibacterium keratini]
MRGGLLVQPQRVGQRGDDLRRRVAVTAAFETDEIFDAHAGQARDLLAAQSRRTPMPQGAKPGIARVDALAP